ncbi:MAG TPA: hypothetical protein VGM98_06690 [Schlesneria sp.]|jgi:hypothetical protein
MTRQAWTIALLLVAALGTAGLGLLTASEPAIPRQRVSPKLLKETADHPVLVTATATHSVSRTLQDMRALAEDLETAGQKAEVARLNTCIKEIVRRNEQELMEKKALVTRLTAEIEDLKTAIGQ